MGSKPVKPEFRTSRVKRVLMQRCEEYRDNDSESDNEEPQGRRSSPRPMFTPSNTFRKKSKVPSINVQMLSARHSSSCFTDLKENQDSRISQSPLQTSIFPLNSSPAPTYSLDRKHSLSTTQFLLVRHNQPPASVHHSQFEECDGVEKVCREKRPRRQSKGGVVRTVYKLNRRKVEVGERALEEEEEEDPVAALRAAAGIKGDPRKFARRRVVDMSTSGRLTLESHRALLYSSSSLLATPISEEKSELLPAAKQYTIRSPQNLQSENMLGYVKQSKVKKSRAELLWTWKGSKGAITRL